MKNNLIANQEVITLPDGNIQTVSFFEGYPVRAILGNKTQVLVSKDVCIALGYANQRQAIQWHVTPEDKGVYSVAPLSKSYVGGGIQRANCINLSGFNALIMHSHKPKAKKLQRFITKDVIPELLATGEFKKRETNTVKDIYTEMFTGGHIEVKQNQPEPQHPALLVDEAVDLEALFKMAEVAVAGGHKEIYQAIMRQAFTFAKEQ